MTPQASTVKKKENEVIMSSGINLTALQVLIVEDSPTQAFLLKESLEKHQLVVTTAKDGMEALQRISEKLPDVIVTDIEMPIMNGYELCKHLKSNTKLKEIPVILLTNLTDPLDVIGGIECSADSFLTKPCEINLLLSTIQNALKNKGINKKNTGGKLEFFFGGKSHMLEVNQIQITELLLSTYNNAIQKNRELEEAYRKLNQFHEFLEKQNDTLKVVNSQKNEFLAVLANDFKRPLEEITGFSSLLLETPKEALGNNEHQMLVEKIYTSSTFMLRLIEGLLQGQNPTASPKQPLTDSEIENFKSP